MSSSKIPYFDDIDLDNLDEVYDAEIELDGRTVLLELTFDSDSVDAGIAEKAKQFIGKLPAWHASNLEIIKQDYTTGDTVAFYLQHHLESLGEESLNTLIDPSNSSISREEQLLSKVHLVRVGIYPEQEEDDYYAIFDYTIGEDFTNYLIVISLKQNGEFDNITTES